MSGFKALNIESDDESDIEVDDTKELQIEDALKLYQAALKFHAEGPDSFENAAEAYEQLFHSDIFKYPESQTELRRIELYGPVTEADDNLPDGFATGAVAAVGGFETGPSTLPQVLHLSHKNYAQFKLEYLAYRLETFNVTLNQILSDASAALEHFVEALDKDDTDLDLWRRTANVGDMLESKRVARFCLEAVLDGDDEGLGSVLSLPGLDEGLAGEQLRDLVAQLDDRLSFIQSPLSTSKRRVLSRMLQQRLNSYEVITDREKALRNEQEPRSARELQRLVLETPSTWAEMGDLLLRQLMAEQHGTSSVDPGVAICFAFSSTPSTAAGTAGTSAVTESVSAESEDAASLATISQPTESFSNRQPTAQADVAPADANIHAVVQDAPDGDTTMADEPATVSLPTRKRSGDAAGLNEGIEEGRVKRGRTRLRDSTTADDGKQALIDANARWEFEQQLNEFGAADDWMFETVGNLFERIGVVGFEAGRNVRQELQSSEADDTVTENGIDSDKDSLRLAKSDLQAFLSNFSDQLAHSLLVGGESLDIAQGSKAAGLNGSLSAATSSKAVSKPPLMANDGLKALLRRVNDSWLLTHEVAWEWIGVLLRQQYNGPSSYTEYLWPDNLKTMVVRTLVNFDESFISQAKYELDIWKRGLSFYDPEGSVGMVEAIFELHVDIYCLIKEPNSGVDAETVAAQRYRLQRWAEFARETIQLRVSGMRKGGLNSDPNDRLELRFLWATTFHLGASSDISQEHAIECMHDLRAVFVAAGEPTIQLQNNAIMPELSVAALDREISKLTTKDFFLKVTSQDRSDPVAVIESLEPLLTSLDEPTLFSDEDGEPQPPPSAKVLPELISFLRNSDMSVRLLLWQRLRDAYLAIDYRPMVVSCYFKMTRLLINEMKGTLSLNMQQHDRQTMQLKSLRLVQDMTAKALTIIQSLKEQALECIDEDNLKATVSTYGEVLQLLQVFNVSGDSIRVGQTQPPKLTNGFSVPSFSAVNALVHDMQVHIWMILYHLLKEAVFQFHELFPNPAEDMFDFLRAVHRNLGLRGICGTSNRIFVRMLKDEFFQMTHIEGYDSEQAQVLYDLYGLNCFLNPNYELIEHHCTHDAFLDRGVALQAVDLLLQQASKLPMKDLAKHSIKDTIDKVHGAAPKRKVTDTIQRNREIYRAFLRAPINPLDLYSCLKGEGNHLAVSYVPKEDALLASKGWYFLMGHIALAKFRTQKRTGPTSTEEIDIAIAFFMQDLEYSMDNWETWFRLAEAYDTKIEESVVWSAEKLNNSMLEIVQLQRAAIHCYCMATALAYRSADLSEETADKMTEMFSEFALRIYASSREPFSMQPFALDDTEKFISVGQGLGRRKPFRPLREYTAWKLARTLFQRALAGKPDSWTLHFMFGKCLWKMHAAPAQQRGPRDIAPTAQQVLSSFVRAIELIPDKEKKDSREKREPVLEPHYKLVSIVHKLVTRGELNLEQAREALNHTPYARTATFPQEIDELVPHVLAVLKNLRAADKSNWHHRMVARAAQIVYDDSDPRADAGGPSQNLGAIGAKHELTQQMFTKTMVLQVWRPECERAGRHFVYTARYTRFFVRILEQLKDRTNLEMLARRVRRRPHDVFEHGLVWQDICNAYLRLLRNFATLAEGLETSTFSNIAYDDFLARKEPLEKWMVSQETGTSPALDVLREVQELKKINSSLMKPGPIDDLIGDSYAYLFNTIGKQLWDEDRRIKQEEEASRPPPAVLSPPRNPMMSLTHLMNVDGTNDSSEAASLSKQPPQDVSAQSDQAPVRRKIGVGRREIRTCAEICFQKAAVTPAATRNAMSHPRVEIMVESRRANANGDASVDTSAPGSIHDSADDESELSEFEEEGDNDDHDNDPIRPIFPGLAGPMESREASEGFETAEEEPRADDDTAIVTEQAPIDAKPQNSEHS